MSMLKMNDWDRTSIFRAKKATVGQFRDFLNWSDFNFWFDISFEGICDYRDVKRFLAVFYNELDPNWCLVSQKDERRLFAVAFLDHPASLYVCNVHVLLRLDKKIETSRLNKLAQETWNDCIQNNNEIVVEDGHSIRDRNARDEKIGHILENVWVPGRDESVIFSTDYIITTHPGINGYERKRGTSLREHEDEMRKMGDF